MSDTTELTMSEEDFDGLKDLTPVANGWDRQLDKSGESPRTPRAFNNQAPLVQSKSSPDLNARDASAVQYSKSLLATGDTLVIIRFPNDQKAYDATGFEIATKHLVYSKHLLDTGSSVFKDMLSNEWHQHRAKRRNNLIGNLPSGVEYVIDLTPPEEGPEALTLTSELSCPEGMLQWYKAVERCEVSKDLVGGLDETAVRPTPTEHHEKSASLHSQAVSAIIDGTGSTNNGLPATVTERNALDYDPIRHRTGIERLLQIIEGKDPRLDSAPKIWTLAVLAEHFDCRTVVMDYIFTWVWADPNCRIIETLPESILRLGMMLQSPRLVQTAYSILVSEEAMDIGTRAHNPGPKETRGFKRKTTKFGRPIEFLDETTSTLIDYAGAAFASRIDKVITDLCDPQMEWLFKLKSSGALTTLTEFLDTRGGYNYEKRMSPITNLKSDLSHYVRGRILWCFTAQLAPHQINRAKEHRFKEAWKEALEQYPGDVYDSLEEKERITTRFFWEILRDLDWGLHCTTNQVLDYMHANHPFHEKQHDFADRRGVNRVVMYSLLQLTHSFNELVLNSIKNHKYNDGKVPAESATHPSVSWVTEQLGQSSLHAGGENHSDAWSTTYQPSTYSTPIAPLASADDLVPSPISVFFPKVPKVPKDESVLSTPTVGPASVNPLNHSPTSIFSPKIPRDECISRNSVFFSLSNFFKDVDVYIAGVCNKMLYSGENDWSTTCDTLLCLTDEEYKFLPLFAGGLNDGSGGVFSDAIPAADKGPSGPGPAFHTGSTLGSRASSLADWDGMSDAYTEMDLEGADSSLGVEDGFSEDHLDRRFVTSEVDFPLLNLPIRGPLGGGPSRAVENVDNEDIMSDSFLETPDEEGSYDFGEYDDDEGNITE